MILRRLAKVLLWATGVTICASLLVGIRLRRNQVEVKVVLEAVKAQPDARQRARAEEVLRARIKQFGKSYGVVRGDVFTGENGRIVIKLRSRKGSPDFVPELVRSGLLELRLVAPGYKKDRPVEKAPKGYETLPMRRKTYSMEVDQLGQMFEEVEYLPVTTAPEMTISDFKSAKVGSRGIWSRPVLTIEFNDADAATFAKLTAANIGRRLAVVIDGEVITAPVVTQPVKNGKVQILGLRSLKEARRIGGCLAIGAMPFPVRVAETRKVGDEMGS